MTILIAWLLADFIAGFVHFAQDRLLLKDSRFLFINSIKKDNDLHHLRPAALLKGSWWSNINTSAPISWAIALVLFLVGAPTVIWLALVFGGFGNLIHRFAHTPRIKLNWFVRMMQSSGLFISFDHHAKHHYGPAGRIEKENTTGYFCPMTNWLNPVLDKVGLFMFIERAVNGRKSQ